MMRENVFILIKKKKTLILYNTETIPFDIHNYILAA